MAETIFSYCIIKVGCSCMAISEPWGLINGHLQSLHNFQQQFGSNCSFYVPSTQFLRTTSWKFELSPRPHPQSDPPLKYKDLATRGFQKKFTHILKPTDLRVWVTNLLPLPDWGLLSKIVSSTKKWVGPRMPWPRSQLSRVPWQENSWIPRNYVPSWCLGTLTAPQTFLLTPASYSHSTSTSLPSCTLGTLSFIVVLFPRSPRGFLQVPHSIIKGPKWHLKWPLVTSKWHIHCLFCLPPWENFKSTAL